MGEPQQGSRPLLCGRRRQPPCNGLLPRVGFDHSPLDDLLPPEPLCERAVGLGASRSFCWDRVFVCVGGTPGVPTSYSPRGIF